MTISNIRPFITPTGLNELKPQGKTNAAEQSSSLNFDQMLETLSQTQNESDALLQKLAAGEDTDLHQVMIASEQMDISFRVALAIRDRLVESYREVMRMAV